MYAFPRWLCDSIGFCHSIEVSGLLPSRCLVEAWTLLRQHSTRLSMDELLGFLYESCQELGLTKELLKLPLSLTEQVGGVGRRRSRWNR